MSVCPETAPRFSAFHEAPADTLVRHEQRLKPKVRVPAGVIAVIVAVDHEVDLPGLDLYNRRLDPRREGHHLGVDQENAVVSGGYRQIGGQTRHRLEEVDSLAQLGRRDLDGRDVLRRGCA